MPTDTVILQNTNWNSVNVEVRKGNYDNAESNPSLGSRTLTRNSDWTIYSDGEDIFYRRDTDPDHPNGQWTSWIHRPCYGQGHTYEENI